MHNKTKAKVKTRSPSYQSPSSFLTRKSSRRIRENTRKRQKHCGVSITALLVYVYPFISTLVSLIYNPRPSAILSFLCFACSITLVVFSSFIYKKRKTFGKSDIEKTAKHYIVGIVFSAIAVAVITYYIIDSLLLLRFLSIFSCERQLIIISIITSLSFFVPMFSLCLALLIVFSINLKKLREFIPPREKEQSTDDN